MTALVAIPVVIVIVAARAVNRGGENRRRLTALLQAAVRAQSLTEGQQIYDALEADARELVGSGDVRLQGGPPGPGEIGSQVKRGRQARWVVAGQRARVADTSADQQVLDALAVVASDALARLQLTEEMVHFARHDPLTDLPNRGILHDRAAHALQRARRRCATVALLLLDLDGFKPVNDRFGHAAGDRVLIEVTDRLRGCVRDGGTVARLGGDEFAVLLEDASREQALVLGERVLEAIRQGILVSGTPMPLSVSIGVALACEDSTPEEILRQADLAMYEAKARGRGRVVEYDPDMGRSRLARLELIEALRDAVAHRRIGLVYQPVVDAATGRIEGVEALARWRVGDVDVPPEEFIAVAEEVGLIVALGEGVLERAAKDAAVLRAVAGRAISVAVNISVQQLREDRFVDVVSRIVDTMGDVQLVLEITEREGVGDDPVVHAAMQEIHSLGVLFAIDDFGVGFSSIGYLRDVPAQIIKADRVLSRNIDRDERACLLLRCITTMGHELGMEVVVEGIERDSQLTTVRDEVHARFAQGFSIHRPMPLAQLIEVLSTPKVSDGAERDRSRTPPSQVLAVVD